MSTPMQLFAKRKKIYARRVWGRFRKLKWLVMVVLLGIYYGVPWIRWDRGPHAPDQAVLIDMSAHRAYFFGIEIWPQEVFYITGLLILAAVGLFFVTSLFGRVWCGYACPQTVWTDLYIWVERIVQGDRNARKKLDDAPWTLEKLRKKTLTHTLWLIIGVFTGGAWVFYFNDAPTLIEQIFHADLSWNVGGWILALTFSTYLMAGFAREQVCTYMCPYARFQSAMFDKNTLVVAYDNVRGEPRGKHKTGTSWEGRGHCIDCDSCVIVCPMGIDIRDGLQMECIACGLCVDACDNVMDKVGLPRGLIGYVTEGNTPFHFFRLRTLWYTLIMTLVGGVMLYALLTRQPLALNVLHDRNPLFVMLSDGSIRNGYAIHVLNKTRDDRVYRLRAEGMDDIQIRVQGTGDLTPEHVPVFADSTGQFRVFLTAPKQAKARRNIVFHLQDKASGEAVKTETVFISEA
jgi:cytochrome c oxidase accessory protein FixG